MARHNLGILVFVCLHHHGNSKFNLQSFEQSKKILQKLFKHHSTFWHSVNILCCIFGTSFIKYRFFCNCIDMVENYLGKTNSNLLMVEKVEWPFCLFQPDHCQAMVYWPLALCPIVHPCAVFSQSRIGSNFWKEGVLLWVLELRLKMHPNVTRSFTVYI